MYIREITKPVGLNALCEDVERVCNNAQIYICGIKPKHMIIPLDSGCGRTTFIEYMTDMYKKHGIFDFSGSLDDYVEIAVDGSSSRNIVKAFGNFKSAAMYRNYYENVAAIDIEGMSKYITSPQFVAFINETNEICRNAYVVFFVSGSPSRNEEKLIKKIIDAVGKNNIYMAETQKYTAEDICSIIEKTLEEYGVLTDNNHKFHAALMGMVSDFDIVKPKEAVETAKELIRFSEISDSKIIVSCKSISELTKLWSIEKEEAERSK